MWAREKKMGKQSDRRGQIGPEKTCPRDHRRGRKDPCARGRKREVLSKKESGGGGGV